MEKRGIFDKLNDDNSGISLPIDKIFQILNQQTNINKLYAASYDLSPPLDLELRSRSFLKKLLYFRY
jgi:hypothetical protein